MPRPKSPPYSLGTISTRSLSSTHGVEARGYFRDARGCHVEVTATGESAAKAKRVLQNKVVRARTEHRGGDMVLNQDTALPRAAEIWVDHKSRERLKASTMRDYGGYVDRSIRVGALAALTVSEANDVARIEAWLTEIAVERSATAATQSRKVLSGILGPAERRGAISSSVMLRVRTPGPKAGTKG